MLSHDLRRARKLPVIRGARYAQSNALDVGGHQGCLLGFSRGVLQFRELDSLAISTSLAGMALGGWLAGAIYDWTGTYAAALIDGIGWNIVNMVIVIWLSQQTFRRAAAPLPRPSA